LSYSVYQVDFWFDYINLFYSISGQLQYDDFVNKDANDSQELEIVQKESIIDVVCDNEVEPEIDIINKEGTSILHEDLIEQTDFDATTSTGSLSPDTLVTKESDFAVDHVESENSGKLLLFLVCSNFSST